MTRTNSNSDSRAPSCEGCQPDKQGSYGVPAVIVSPQRRIVLYPVAGDDAIEILVLGEEREVATMHALMRSMLEAWRGWRNVETVAMGTTAIGLRAQLSLEAHHVDVLAEATRMLQGAERVAINLEMVWRPSPHAGYVATW